MGIVVVGIVVMCMMVWGDGSYRSDWCWVMFMEGACGYRG